MNYYTEAFTKKFADFSGRARPQEFWMFVLFNVGAAFIALIIDAIIGTGFVFYGLYILASIIPSLAVSVRRLHDTDKSGWWLLIGLIPFGGIVLLVFYIMGGTPGTNQYGPNPAGTPGYAEAFAAASSQPAPVDVTGELERLANLKDRGAITEEEFNQRKQAVLDKI
jgi:uncharacterized membrane protein YhaH (DUF805 family)